MRNLILNKLSFGICLIAFLSACDNQKADSETTISTIDTSGKELWAERIESSLSLTRPEGWTQEDWKSVAQGIEQEKIFNTILESVMSGQQQAYDYISDTPITIDQVKGIITRVDSSWVDDGNGNFKAEVSKITTTAKDISTVKCREQWYFDKEKFSLQSKISSIALFTNVYNETGDLMGIKALFYVKLNN